MGRSPCFSKVGLNRGAWTAAEDQILADYIKLHGEGRWRSVPSKSGLKRCGKSCRLRWLNYLKPDIKRGNIAHDEEDLIIRLHKLLGNRWSLIAGRLPGRTDNEIKNYWNTILAKRVHHHHHDNSSSKTNLSNFTSDDGKMKTKAPKETEAEVEMLHINDDEPAAAIPTNAFICDPNREGMEREELTDQTEYEEKWFVGQSQIFDSNVESRGFDDLFSPTFTVLHYNPMEELHFSDLLNLDFESSAYYDFYHGNCTNFSVDRSTASEDDDGGHLDFFCGGHWLHNWPVINDGLF